MQVTFPDDQVVTIEVRLDPCNCSYEFEVNDWEHKSSVQARERVASTVCEFFERPRIAAVRFLQLQEEDPGGNWAVHLGGRHILKVTRDGGTV